jgi:MerR family transcriptional regulator, heat shock protein HspR
MSVDGQLDEPRYVISVAARLVDLHPQTLRHYESIGLVNPRRSDGNIRLYSQRDIERVRKIARLMDELGVNLAGVEIILHMGERLEELQNERDAAQRDAHTQLRERTLQILRDHLDGKDPNCRALIEDLEDKL